MACYYAQHGEDGWLEANLDRLGISSPGFFVDVGAADGLQISNTAWLERSKGWRGICIEPDPRQIKALRANRSCTVVEAAISTDPLQPFMLTPEPTLSGFLRSGSAIIVPTFRLDEVLQLQGVESIDLLSIDTEGTELDVWASFDHARYTPKIVIIEWITLGLPRRTAEITQALVFAGYRLETTLGGNLIFARLSLPA